MTTHWWLPAFFAAAASWLALPGPRGARASAHAWRIGATDDRPVVDSRGRSGWVAAVLAGSVLLPLVLGVQSGSLVGLVVIPLFGLLLVSIRAMMRRWRLRAARVRGRTEVIEFCDALVAELQAGLPAQQVVANACRPWPGLAPVAATARLGGDLTVALRAAARRPGAQGLRLIAASWEVSGRSGAGLAVVLDRVSVALREDEEAHAEVAAALGSPRATAKLLAGLPLVGLGLGTLMGVEPVRFLATSLAGNVCLFIGIGLALVGHWWVERLAAAVEG